MMVNCVIFWAGACNKTADMLLDWGAHLNLEFCGSTYTALYLYKYLFKGNKKVKAAFDNTADVFPGFLYL